MKSPNCLLRVITSLILFFAIKSQGASTPPPLLLDPPHGAGAAPLRPTFSWSSTSSNLFEFQLAATSNFEDPLYVARGLSETFHNLSNLVLTADQQWFWRIRETSTQVNGGWSATNTFRTWLASPPPAPVIYDGNANVITSDGGMLTSAFGNWWWIFPTNSGAPIFPIVSELQIDDSPDFNSPLKSFDYAEQYILGTKLEPGRTYFLRLRGRTGYGAGPWRTAAFRTPPAISPSVPRLLTPPIGSEDLSRQPDGRILGRFSWTEAEGANWYRIEFAADPQFKEILLKKDLGTLSFNPSYQGDLFGLPEGRAIYWRVVAGNAYGEVSSESWHFSLLELPDFPSLSWEHFDVSRFTPDSPWWIAHRPSLFLSETGIPFSFFWNPAGGGGARLNELGIWTNDLPGSVETSVARDAADGTIWVSFVVSPGHDEDLWVGRYGTVTSNKWVFEPAFAQGGLSIGLVNRIFVTNGVAHITHMKWNSRELVYTSNSSGTWASEVIGPTDWVPAPVGLDAQGRVQVIMQQDQKLLRGIRTAEGWAFDELPGSVEYAFVPNWNAAFDPITGVPHVVTISTGNQLNHIIWTNEMWVSSEIASLSSPLRFETPTIAIGFDHKAHVAAHEAETGFLFYGSNLDDQWRVSVVDRSGEFGVRPAIAVNQSNFVAIAHVSRSFEDFRISVPTATWPKHAPAPPTNLTAFDSEVSASGAVFVSWIVTNSPTIVEFPYWVAEDPEFKKVILKGAAKSAGTGYISSGFTIPSGTLKEGVTYFVRVLARNRTASSASIETSFTTMIWPRTTPEIPVLYSPETNATNVLLSPFTPPFTWSSRFFSQVPPPDIRPTDRLQVAQEPNFMTPVFDVEVAGDLKNLPPGTVMPGRRYFWRVIRSNSHGNVSSEVRSFATVGPPVIFLRKITDQELEISWLPFARVPYAPRFRKGLDSPWLPLPSDGKSAARVSISSLPIQIFGVEMIPENLY
jgi:hypothetical protein